MKICIYIFILMSLSSCGQVKSSPETKNIVSKKESAQKTAQPMADSHYPVFEKGSPKAKELLQDSFFFDPMDEAAPFGSDDGFDAYAHFTDWRKANAKKSPVIFVNYLIDYWGYQKLNLEETDFDKLKPYLANAELNLWIMTGIDQAIVATAFGQLYLEGKIDADIKALAKTSIKRELLPQILNRWPRHAEREANLHKLISVLNAPGI